MSVTGLRLAGRTQDTGSVRWVPRRAGILNVWRYFDEVFEFHRGRLLLRGPNGSGKSKALEVLLPFLLDASVRARRLSTFGTSERTMHWNLMGDGTDGRTRVGYVWLEFSTDVGGGGTEQGHGRRWFVIGARLQASVHTTTVQSDYFTLHRRVGDGEFVTADGQPLTRAALAERLGSDGTVHGSATDHRAAVRSVLFGGMSEQRYESLILALLQLRTPKLSQRLDPSLLSSLLSRALPPLGETELSELAEGFERLDHQREELERLDAEVEAAKRLSVRQQTYARRAVRSAAGALISATSEMDTRTRHVRESEQSLDAVRGEHRGATGEAQRARDRRQLLVADIEALRSRADYQDGEQVVRELDDLHERLRGSRERARSASTAAAGAEEIATSDAGALRSAEQRVAAVRADADRLGEAAGSQAERASVRHIHQQLADLVATDRRQALGLIEATVTTRQSEIREVGAAVDTHGAAVERRGFAEQELDEARDALSVAIAERGTRDEELDAALSDRQERITAWAAGLAELSVDVAILHAAARDERRLIALVDGAVEHVRAVVLAERATITAQQQALEVEREDTARELADTRTRRDVEPAAPSTRTADRVGAGRPFWRLVDFADELDDVVRAGVEAALQASGLLDAWVTVDGRAVVEGHDVLADPARLAPAPGRSLADVLRPEPDTSVPVDRVQALLEVVAFGEDLPGEHPAAVGGDGTWRLGPLTGSWFKPEPEFVGATARARARARRIAELEQAVIRLNARITGYGEQISLLDTRLGVVTAERAGLPDRSALDAAQLAFDRAELAVGTQERAVGQWVQKLTDATVAVDQRLRSLTELAARTGLPTRRDELANLAEALDRYRSGAVRWLDRCADLGSARGEADAAHVAATRSRSHADDRAADLSRAESELRGLVRKEETLAGSIDQSYHVVVERIAALRRDEAAAEADEREATEQATAAEIRIAKLEERLAAARENRDEATAKRDEAGDRFRVLCTETLLADANLDLPRTTGSDGVRATLDAARAAAALLPEVTSAQVDNALARLAEVLHGVRDVLGARADLELETVGEHQVLTAVAGGVRTGSAGLLSTVRAEALRARDDITAAEHQLFETTLTGDTRRHLADRIRQASALVDEMNERLQEVRTASDVAVQLVWQVDPDLPPSAQAARTLLLRNPASLAEAEREALHRFFRDRVDQARAADSAQSWEEQLGQVFDYTGWHRFVVRIDRARGEGWQTLTKKLHGALSGGEKAIALHLPLFAAVAAHYESVPQAPRMILLDEVFVGVDTVNRGQVFALLASLDLDLVLTSDHEWGAYSELDGIAVHQLITDDVDRAVTTARFVWDGYDWLSGADEDHDDGTE